MFLPPLLDFPLWEQNTFSTYIQGKYTYSLEEMVCVNYPLLKLKSAKILHLKHSKGGEGGMSVQEYCRSYLQKFWTSNVLNSEPKIRKNSREMSVEQLWKSNMQKFWTSNLQYFEPWFSKIYFSGTSRGKKYDIGQKWGGGMSVQFTLY